MSFEEYLEEIINNESHLFEDCGCCGFPTYLESKFNVNCVQCYKILKCYRKCCNGDTAEVCENCEELFCQDCLKDEYCTRCKK